MKLTRVSDLRSLKLTVTAQMGAVQRQARASRSQDGQHLKTLPFRVSAAVAHISCVHAVLSAEIIY